MKKTWSIAAVCGLVAAIGIGIATVSRAQKAEPKGDTEEMEKLKRRDQLGDQLSRLQTDIEILQLEHDAVRADFAERLTQHRTLLRNGLGPDEKKAIVQTIEMLDAIPEADRKRFIDDFERAAKTNPAVAEELKAVGNLNASNISQSSDALIKLETAKRKHSLLAAIKETKAELITRASKLNSKKLELEEAETRYKQIR